MKTILSAAKRKLLLSLLSLVMFATVSNSATVTFSAMYIGSGASYTTNTQSILSITQVLGSNITFTSAVPGDPLFPSGNDVTGFLTYTPQGGSPTVIYGQISRKDKVGNTVLSFYFLPTTDNTYSTLTGQAYLFVVPGQEANYSNGMDVSTSSDNVYGALNDLLAAQVVPTITLDLAGAFSTFTSCTGVPSAPQTFSVTGQTLTAPIIVTAPTDFEISLTAGGTYTTSLSLTPASGVVPSTTIYIRLSASAANGASGNISAASTGATTQTLAVSAGVVLAPSVSMSSNGADGNKFCAGATATFTATPTDGGTTPNYQWKLNGVDVGTNSPTYSSSTLVNGDKVKVVMTSTATECAGSSPVTSNEITVFVMGSLTVTAVPDQVINSGTSTTAVNFTSGVVGATYNWTNNNATVYASVSGTGNVPSFVSTNAGNSPIVATFSVTATATNGSLTCSSGSATTYTVTVNPEATMNNPGNFVAPSGGTVGPINFTTNNTGGVTTYAWTNDHPEIGLAASGNGSSIPSFTAVNNTTAPIVATITVIPTYTSNGVSVQGAPITFTITVNPVAQVDQPSDQVVCNNSATTAVTFSTVNTGGTTTYAWTNNTPSIGLSATGTGNIASFTAVNATASPIVATITVTPTFSNAGVSEAGPSKTFTITVNPTPNAVATPASQTICSGTAFSIAVSGSVAGSTFTWTRDNTTNVTGIAASGTGNISGTPLNNTSTQQLVNFTITPSANNCAGTSITATLAVNKEPRISCPSNITVNNDPGLCGAVVNYPAATATGSPVPVITYSQASGSFFPVGTTTVTVTATNSCGTVTCSFTVTVNDAQAPVITCPSNISVSNTAGVCGANVNYPFPTVSDNCGLPGGTAVNLTQTTNNTTIVPIQIGCQSGGLTTENSWWRAYNLAPLNLPAGLTIKSVNFGIEKITGGIVPITARIYISNGAFPASTRTLVGQATANFPVQAGTFGTISFPAAISVPANAIIAVELYCPDQRSNGRSFYIGSNDLGESAPSYLSAASCGVVNPTPIADLVPTPLDHIILNVSGEYYQSAPTLVQTAGIARGGFFPVGTTVNTFRATDAAGNTSTCSFTVTVNDVQAPTITCPANIVKNTDAGVCTASVAVPNPVLADNCAVTQLTWTMTGATTASSPATGINYVGTATFNLSGTTGSGVTTVTYTVKDAAGNTTTCSFTVTVNDAVRPVISAQPATKFFCAGSNALFSVGAGTNGGPLAYQWQEWNGSAWVNIAGATSSSLTISNVSMTDNTRTYRVVLTGLCTVVNSAAANLYINPIPTVSIFTNSAPAILPNQRVDILSYVSLTGGSYSWYRNNIIIPGATASTLRGVSVDEAGVYKLIYTDPNGCTATAANTVEVVAQASGRIFLYPNPNKGNFHVRVYNKANEKITLQIFDDKGSLVYRYVAAASLPYTDIPVDLTKNGFYPSGVYIVQLIGEDGRIIGSEKVLTRIN